MSSDNYSKLPGDSNYRNSASLNNQSPFLSCSNSLLSTDQCSRQVQNYLTAEGVPGNRDARLTYDRDVVCSEQRRHDMNDGNFGACKLPFPTRMDENMVVNMNYTSPDNNNGQENESE